MTSGRGAGWFATRQRFAPIECTDKQAGIEAAAEASLVKG